MLRATSNKVLMAQHIKWGIEKWRVVICGDVYSDVYGWELYGEH